jgi:NAD(P)H dehydrogenase (quinone)
MAKILVAFYSTYGHTHTLADSVAEGARSTGADVTLKKFPELLPDDKLKEMGAYDAQQQWAHVPELDPDELAEYDGILFGIPTRYGNIPQQVAAVLDRTGGLWSQGKLIGKVGSVFTSTASQHGGQETTCLGFYTFLIHMGMLISGVPYAVQKLLQNDTVMGGSPYGAATIASGDGSRRVTDDEKEIAREQGRIVAEYAKKLAS